MPNYILKDTLDDIFKDIKVDKKLGKSIRAYRLSWVSESKANTEFAGTNLLGTVRPVFNASTVNGFFEIVLGLEISEVRDRLYSLTVIPRDRLVASDIYNIVTSYLMHRFISAKLYDYALESYLMFGYKILVRRHNHFFVNFNISKEISMIAYEQMSNHYIIKVTGSVDSMLRYRAKDFVDKKGVNYKRMDSFETEEVFKAIVDGFGRINSMLKSVMGITMEVMREGTRVNEQSAIISTTDGNVVRSITTGLDNEINLLLKEVGDTASFVNDEYMALAVAPTVIEDTSGLRELLIWLSNNYSDKKYHDTIKNLIIDSLSVTNTYLLSKGIDELMVSNLPMLLVRSRGMWGSSRPNDKVYEGVKKSGKKITKVATKRNDKPMVSILTTSMFLYFFIKVLIGRR